MSAETHDDGRPSISLQNILRKLEKGSTLFMLGADFLGWISESPTRLGQFTRFSMNVPPLSELVSSFRQHGHEALPVPLLSPSRGASRSRRLRARSLRTWRLDCWVDLCLLALNALFLAVPGSTAPVTPHTRKKERSVAWSEMVCRRNPTHNAVVAHIRARLSAFFSSAPTSLEVDHFSAGVLSGTCVDYSTGNCYKALPLKDELVLFPAKGEAACVSAVALASPELRPLLEDPTLTLLPPERWPEKPPRARVWAEPGEFDKIVRRAVDLGVMGGVRRDKVFHAGGNIVLNGAFGVEKVKHGRIMQRFIANLMFNKYSDRFSSGSQTLGHPGFLTLVLLEEGEVLLMDEDDECNCFHLYELPQAWMSYFAFNHPMDGTAFGGEAGEVWFPALRVIPMGWVSSTDVLQDIARGLITERARLSPGAELLLSNALPSAALRSPDGAWWNYIDNFNVFRVVCRENLPGTQGFPAPATCRVRDAKAAQGIPLDLEKRKDGDLAGVTLGAMVNGDEGWIGVPREKRQMLMVLLLRLLSFGACPVKPLLAVLGKLAHAFQFERALFSVLWFSYRAAAQARAPRHLPPAVVDELILSFLLLPLADTSLRTPLDPCVSATDASPWGGAGGEALVGVDLVREWVAQADFRGAAVRLDGREELGRKMRPGRPFPAADFSWKVCHAYGWTHAQHITLLEAHAALLWVRRRARNLSKHGMAFLHILDSWACLGGLAKGRSSSWRLNRVLRRIGALKVAAGMRQFLAWTSSALMPMDEASRRRQPKFRHR